MGKDSGQQAGTEALERLLAGETVDRCGSTYDLDAWHLAAIATGAGSGSFVRRLAGHLDREVLLAGGEGVTTCWWGSRRAFEEAELAVIAAAALRRDGLLALGEPGSGVAGWRTTHRQATAAYAIALRAPRPFCRYGDVALLAAVAADRDLADFLEETFLAPLCDPGRRDRELPATLRAYLDARGDVSSAAAALDVGRETVAARIDTIEERIGRPLQLCLAELDLALKVGELA